MGVPPAEQVEMSGTVSEWNPRGFGFVTMADGTRAYIHNSECGGEHLEVGESITADIVPDPKNPGKFAAVNVQRGAGVTTAAGTVAEWDPRGFGFLAMEDGTRAYVHNSQCGGARLEVGETITAEITIDPKNPGKFCAWNVQRTSAGWAPPPEKRANVSRGANASASAVSGTVSEWNPRGYGFVMMADGTRAYVHNSSCGGEHLAVGESITADISPDPKNPGKFTALNVRRGPAAAPFGTVSEWNPRGFGFVMMSDGTRAYVHNSQCGGEHLEVGDTITADIAPDPRNPGKMTALNVQRFVAASAPMVSVPAQIQSGPSTSQMSGTVSEWNPRGFGFIMMADGTRAYVHNSQCAGEHLEVGENVTAEISPDPRNPGKFTALNVCRGGSGAASGTVCEWSSRGFGFVMMADGTRAYVHNSQCGGQHLEVGEAITADIAPDPNKPGKFAAFNVQRKGAASSTLPRAVAPPPPPVPALSPSGSSNVQVSCTVSEWNPRGFGFVALQDGTRAYVHNSECGGQHLEVGESVIADIDLDPLNPGKFAAVNVRRGPAASAPMARAAAAPWSSSSQMMSGKVSEWNPRGFGFVEMDDGTRAYVHNSECGGEHLEVGEAITASILPDSKNPGKFAAFNVQRGAAASAPMAPSWASSAQPHLAPSSSQMSGKVSEWNPRGFGFVEMNDGTRAYVHNSECGGEHLEVGEAITANILPDPKNPGKFAAVNVHRGSAADDPQASSPEMHLGPQISGTVSEWNARGFGFVTMEDGTRAYVHNSQCGGEHLEVGESIAAVIAPDPKNPGKFRACNVERISASGAPPAKRMKTSHDEEETWHDEEEILHDGED